jgi:hypothetical protein
VLAGVVGDRRYKWGVAKIKNNLRKTGKYVRLHHNYDGHFSLLEIHLIYTF